MNDKLTKTRISSSAAALEILMEKLERRIAFFDTGTRSHGVALLLADELKYWLKELRKAKQKDQNNGK